MTHNKTEKTNLPDGIASFRATLLRVVLPAALTLFAACSTQPKQTGEVFELRPQAESRLDLGNKQADRGDYENARVMLVDAQRLAVITDNPSLRIRCALSLGNVLFALGYQEEASLEWNAALAEAQSEGNSELEAVSRIHIARFNLLTGITPAATVRDEITEAINAIKSDELYVAFGLMIAGLAENKLGNYGEAETLLKRCLAIHEKKRSLEQAAYDWFLIASFRSMAGNYASAAEALTQAVLLDRQVENSYGLATDWRALGDVYKKAGNPEESRAAYLRASRIFRALGNEPAAQEAESRIN